MTEETVLRLDLPVGEALEIHRTRFGSPSSGGGRLSVVSGTHGDELEGLYVCALLAQTLAAQPELLSGVIDLYPALNPLGIDTITRSLPVFEMDLNRSFRLDPQGPASFVGQLTEGIFAALEGSSAVIDIHASNIFLREIPQVRLSAGNASRLLPLARRLNVDFLWVHDAVTVFENTLAHSLNARGTPCLVVEMGVGMRLTEAYARALVRGILALAGSLGLWKGPAEPVKTPLESTGGQIHFLNAGHPGLFVPSRPHGDQLTAGDEVGQIVSPRTGTVLEVLRAPADSLLFTLREYPVVMEGSLLARLWQPGPGGAP